MRIKSRGVGKKRKINDLQNNKTQEINETIIRNNNMRAHLFTQNLVNF